MRASRPSSSRFEGTFRGQCRRPRSSRLAKLGYVVDDWMRAADVTITAIQCWTSMEEYLGVMPCTVMSMLSNSLLSSACETDVCGALSMHALTLAAETPSALLDWNNNYGDDADKVVCFHCSNLPKHFLQDARMHYGEIIATSVGQANACGTVAGRVKSGPMSYARISTDDVAGGIRGYVGGGSFTDDPLTTFGGAGVAHIPRLQELMHYVCENGLEHHVAANLGAVAGAVHEAVTRYLGWDVRLHGDAERR
jgi:L-fucose isomerase-like protein